VTPKGRLYILTGPTSVGKTDVAVDVALRLGTEIISADSMAVYRRMEVATAKPDAEQRAKVPHHLIDVADPTEPFTVSDYRRLAIPIIERLHAEGRTPLIVGGTRLYLMALTAPFDVGPEPSPELRAALEARDTDDLHAELTRRDPETASKLHPGNRRRVIRALEVLETIGKPLSQVQEESRTAGGLYDATWVALMRDRQELYRRVNARAEEMMANGLVEEIQGFLDEGLTAETPSMQGHGYKEIMRALTGEYDLGEGLRLLQRNTRHYVKYQLMSLRGMPHVRYVDAEQPHETVIQEVLKSFAATH
jgi:tRNA dimethylallyltransferase